MSRSKNPFNIQQTIVRFLAHHISTSAIRMNAIFLDATRQQERRRALVDRQVSTSGDLRADSRIKTGREAEATDLSQSTFV